MKKIILSLLSVFLLSGHYAKAEAQVVTSNSGIVILQVYIPRLMSVLNLTQDNLFVNELAQKKCVVALNYLATGKDEVTQESKGLLNVLCGLPINTNINPSLSLSSSEKKTIQSLISSAIAQWPSVGDMNNDGLRSTFLIRPGVLEESQGQWDLTVERRVYDVLIHRSPFTFSNIKFNWMSKNLYVHWNF